MASATPHPGKRSGQQPGQRPGQQPGNTPAPQRRAAPANGTPEVVDPVWLLKAGGLVIVAALICGYLTLCLLFYQGQWQLVLHPNRAKPAPADIAGMPFEIVRFGVDESGSPQLAGWWIPASPQGRFATDTILYLPSGDGSLADAQPTLVALHSLGINIFAFDYRGYGQSAATHPNERRMTQDTASAWQYLTVSRGIAGERIIPFGDGVGASLGADLAASQSPIPGVVLQSPRPDLITFVLNDPRVGLLPVRTLFHDTFDVSARVKTLKTPKLFLLQAGTASIETARSAANPKTIVALPVLRSDQAAYLEQIARFLDQSGPNVVKRR